MRKFEGFVRVVFTPAKGVVKLVKGSESYAGKQHTPDNVTGILDAIAAAMDANKCGLSFWAAWTPGIDGAKLRTKDYTAADLKKALAQSGATPVIIADKYGNPKVAILTEAKQTERKPRLVDY